MEALIVIYLPTAVASFLLTIGLVPLIKIIAQKFGFVSKIDFRRRELAPRPLLGGVAIFNAVVIANAALNILPWSLVLPGLGLTALGIVDDRFQIHPRLKMLGELACVGLWLALTPAENLLLVRLGMEPPLAYALHAFWVVGLINAFNMIDGMDGLASGMAMIGFAFTGWFMPHDLQLFAFSAAAACAGHLVYNRPPASIFLGDSGSLLLGFWLSAMGSLVRPTELHSAALLIPLFILAHPEIDAILAMVRRARNGTPLMQGDKDHIHHKLRRIGLGPHEALAVIFFATLYCGFTAVLLDEIRGSSWVMTLAALLCMLGISILLAAIYHLEFRLAAQFSQIGTPLLHRQINVTKDPVWPQSRYEAVVFDLLPYYKELQERGLAETAEFVSEFSAWFNKAFSPEDQIVPAGSYSLIVVSRGEIDRARIVNAFKGIALSHGILKNAVGLPWGLSFYSSQTDAQLFEQKFGLFLRSRMVELVKAA